MEVISRRPARISTTRLIEQAQCQDHPPLDLSEPVSHDYYFLCPTSTPLYYTDFYQQLTEPQARRYNQLTALSFNELLTLFESQACEILLPTLAAHPSVPPELAQYLAHFRDEELEHLKLWRALNQSAEPQWYGDTLAVFVKPSNVALKTFQWACRHPRWFPMLVWLVLMQEELAMELARRAGASDFSIEPHFLKAYRQHREDEVRHVQVDWYLIDSFYQSCPSWIRLANARLFRACVKEFFIRPARMALRVFDRLCVEFPELVSERGKARRQLRELAADEAYHTMLYSRRSHPITFSLFDQVPEFHAMSRVLLSYDVRTEES